MQFSVFSDVPGSGGKKFAHRVSYDGAESFARELAAVPPRGASWNPWWSPHVWRQDRRLGDDWESSSMVVFDLDHEPIPGQHASLTDDVRKSVLASPPSCGNVWHFSPRGMRVVFLLQEVCRDRAEYAKIARGASRLIQKWIDSNPSLSVLKNDPSVFKDYARLVYPPNAVISGVSRAADVVVCRSSEYDAYELSSLDTVSEIKPVVSQVDVRSDSSFSAALQDYNRTHFRDWGRPGSGHCPFHPDKGDACFGALPADPSKWCCWSEHHISGGTKSPNSPCWTGDAADVDAYLAGISVFELITGNKPSELSNAEASREIDQWGSDWKQAHTERVRFVKRVGEEYAAIDFAERILALNGVYSRGGGCCRVIDGKIVPVRQSDAASLVGRYISWFRPDSKGNLIPWDPAPSFAQQVVGRSSFSFLKPLDVVVKIPVLLPDGRFISSPGYDDATGIYFWPERKWGELPQKTDRASAQRCFHALMDLVCDFPFASDADRAVWLAALLTPLCRRFYQGNTPMFVFTSTTPGSGKTLLVTLISLILTGETCPVASLTKDAGEFQKELFSALKAGALMRLFDNVTGEVRAPGLEAVLTSGGLFTGRVLGESREATLPVTTTFFLTGNNVQAGGDLYRRVVTCELAPNCSNPENRSDFKIIGLEDYVKAHQVELYVSAARIVQGWIQAGRPTVKKSSFGSFEPWGMIRDILAWIGMPDPVRSGEATASSLSQEREAHDLLLRSIHALRGSQPFTVFDLVSDMNATRATYASNPGCSMPAEWGDLYEAFQLGERMDRFGRDVDPVRVGNWFRSVAGRWSSGLCLVKCGKNRVNKILWNVACSE